MGDGPGTKQRTWICQDNNLVSTVIERSPNQTGLACNVRYVHHPARGSNCQTQWHWQVESDEVYGLHTRSQDNLQRQFLQLYTAMRNARGPKNSC